MCVVLIMKLTLDSGKHQREKTIADHAIGSEYFTEKIIMLNHQWDMTKLNFFVEKTFAEALKL